MRRTLAVAATLSLTLGGACADAAGVDPIAPELAKARFAEMAIGNSAPIAAAGEFQTFVDLSTLTLTPRGRHCQLEVDGSISFSGTIEGSGTGHTSALVFASCADVAAAAPGTYPDRFRSTIEFDGTVDGEPVTTRVIYSGRSRAGGEIDGSLRFTEAAHGLLGVDARVAVGGSYKGKVIFR